MVRIDATPQLVKELHQVMPIGEGKQPTQIFGAKRKDGTFRLIGADYPNGWRLTANLNKKHEVTSSKASYHLVVKG